MRIQLLKLLLVLLFGLLLTLRNAWAQSPEWVTEIKREDHTFRYYLGRASNAANEAEAFNQATRDAYEQAIAENFGIRTRVDTESYESGSELSLTRRANALSKEVELHDFEQMQSQVEEKSEKYSAWVLYRYPKVAIELEKFRLEKIKNEEKQIVFQEAGSHLDSSKGVLEVITSPNGAQIFIDDLPANFLETPLRLYGKLPYGKHRLRIEHPKYISIEEDIVISPGATVRVDRSLVKATGKIKVITTPSNANVLVNGKLAGTTPTAEITVPAHERISVEISHSETEKISQEIEVEKEDSRTLDLTLTYKPAVLTVTSNPIAAKVSINSQHIGTTPLSNHKLEAGTYTVLVEMDGHESHSKTIKLKGGEKLLLSNIKLRKFTSDEIAEQEEKAREQARKEEVARRPSQFSEWQENRKSEIPMVQKDLWLGVFLGLGSSPIESRGMTYANLGVSIEKNLNSLLGLQLTASYYYAESFTQVTLDNNKKNRMEGFEVVGSLPVYLTSHLFLQPEYGMLISTLKVFNANTNAATTYKLRQSFYGGGIGVYMVNNNIAWIIRLGSRSYSSPGEVKGTVTGFGTFSVMFPL